LFCMVVKCHVLIYGKIINYKILRTKSCRKYLDPTKWTI